MKDGEIRKTVRERYASIATGGKSSGEASTPSTAECCSTEQSVNPASCCAPQEAVSAASCCSPQDTFSKAIGYKDEELGEIPDGANLGLGCGNPTALASLKEGEVVLDLGSGGGIDCFLAANAVGQSGKVIGIDMTPDMLERARENARKGGYTNVEFRLGEIENLPVADNSVDVVISNCVINLSLDKGRVFKEAYRALKPGGRVMVSDIVLLKELPESVRNDMTAWACCIGGANMKEEYLGTIEAAGFQELQVVSETPSGKGELEGTIASVNVCALKPR